VAHFLGRKCPGSEVSNYCRTDISFKAAYKKIMHQFGDLLRLPKNCSFLLMAKYYYKLCAAVSCGHWAVPVRVRDRVGSDLDWLELGVKHRYS